MVITIDGPAGAGKSSVARELARQLGFHFLDTGAMYRAVAYLALQGDIGWDDASALGQLAAGLQLEFRDAAVLLDGEDVSQAIREPEVTDNIHHVADNLQVREALVLLQRRLAASGDVVTEGRDQGTVAFPEADCKIFLTASPQERARRRQAQLQSQGIDVDGKDVLSQLQARDERDVQRPVGALQPADDAITVDTDQLNESEVVMQLVRLVEENLSQPGSN
jgi:cytidylate kinase